MINQNIEASWQKASASLDASAKIYGYRVDSVHNETFKFLGGLNRAEQKHNDNDIKNVDERKREKKISSNGELTLEKNISKLDAEKYDLTFEVDALFKNMTSKFNDSGARGLLLKSLPLDQNLDILLESANANIIADKLKGELNKIYDKKKNNNEKTLSNIIESNYFFKKNH